MKIKVTWTFEVEHDETSTQTDVALAHIAEELYKVQNLEKDGLVGLTIETVPVD